MKCLEEISARCILSRSGLKALITWHWPEWNIWWYRWLRRSIELAGCACALVRRFMSLALQHEWTDLRYKPVNCSPLCNTPIATAVWIQWKFEHRFECSRISSLLRMIFLVFMLELVEAGGWILRAFWKDTHDNRRYLENLGGRSWTGFEFYSNGIT